MAKANNQKTIFSDLFTPVVAALVQTDNLVARREATTPPVTLFNNPWVTLATAIGVPLFQQLLGGNSAQQSRAIAISDLEVRVEQLRRNRRELEGKVKDTITQEILTLERLTLEQEQAARRLETEQKRQRIREIQYRTGSSSTVEYLTQLERLENLTLSQELARKVKSIQLSKVTRYVLGNAAPATAPDGNPPSS